MDEEMKVLYISNMYPTNENPYFGIFVKEQIDSLQQKGVEIKVKQIGRSFGGYRRIFSLKEDVVWADIIHCHFGHTGSIALFWKLFYRTPLVVSYCGDDLFGGVAEGGGYHIKGKSLSKLNSLLSQHIDYAIVKSRELGRKVKTKNIEVIPNGVDVDMFVEMDQGEARDRAGIAECGDKVILFLGQKNNPIKNFPLCEEALKLIGKGIKCLFLDDVPRKDVVLYMNAADACVLTSIHEGSPNAVKEAMACNRPVVSVDVGDVDELLDGVEGCYIVPRNAKKIAETLKKALVLQRSSGKKRLIELGLDMESTADKIIKVYRDILEGESI